MNLSESWASFPWVPDRRPVWDWARDNITLPNALARRGRFDLSGSRHFMEPFQWLKDERVREVNIRAPVRSGKTLLADLWMPWTRANDPGSVLWVFQDEAIAKSHAEMRAMPALKSVAAIRDILPTGIARHKQRTNNVLFPDGLLITLIGPAVGGLQSRGFRYVILDEPWLYDSGIIEEAKGRLGDFEKIGNSKLLAISQGGVDGDDWETQYNSGATHEWQVQCAACGHYQEPRWSGFRPDGSRWGICYESEKSNRGFYNEHQAIETLRFECEVCRHQHRDTEATRAAWNATGRYHCAQPGSGSRMSAHWNCLIDGPWETNLLRWLSARTEASKGNFEPTIIFFQKRLAEPKSERTAIENTQPLSRSNYAVLPEASEGSWRIMTVDKQGEGLFWCMIRDWKTDKSGVSHRVWWGPLYSWGEVKAKAELWNIKTVQFRGTKHDPAFNARLVAVDSGFEAKGDYGVYAACAQNGWLATRGVGATEGFTHDLGEGQRVEKVWAPRTFGQSMQGISSSAVACHLIRFASDPVCDIMQRLIDAGSWIEPIDTGDENENELKRQMSSERRRMVKEPSTQRMVRRWQQIAGRPNHGWDCAKQQTLVASRLGLI